MTAIPLDGGTDPAHRSIVGSPATHIAASAGAGIIVGAIVAAALRHAHDPAVTGLSFDLSRPESVVMVLVGGLFVGPIVAAVFRSARLLLAVALAAVVGGPALAAVLAATLSGGSTGGADRFLGWTLAVAAVYALAGAVTAPGAGRGYIVATAVALVLAVTAVSTLELRSQDRWRTWDVAHHGVALVLPDIAGFEPTGMRFYSAGIHVEMSGGGGTVLVDLLDGAASRVRSCDSGTCWNRPGDRWSSASVVTRRHGDRLVQIHLGEGARVEVSVDVPLRPVTAGLLARLPVLPPPEYED